MEANEPQPHIELLQPTTSYCQTYGHFPASWDHTTTCIECSKTLTVTQNGKGETVITEQAQA